MATPKQMPGILEAILLHVPDDGANKLWEWLDETPDAVDQMIAVLVSTHPKLREKTNVPVADSSRPEDIGGS